VTPTQAAPEAPAVDPSKSKPQEGERKQGSVRVTIDGKDATPEEEAVWAAILNELLCQAIKEAVQQGMEEVCKKLNISDDMERKLIFRAFQMEGQGDGEGTLSVYLIRPGKAFEMPQLIVLTADGKPFVRLTRVIGQVHRPLALVTGSWLVEGRPSFSEMFLVYDETGEWKQQVSSKRTDDLKLDTKRHDQLVTTLKLGGWTSRWAAEELTVRGDIDPFAQQVLRDVIRWGAEGDLRFQSARFSPSASM
jgi:hypothetical protein